VFRVSFSDAVGIAGIVLAIVLVVLDKAGKLRGGWLYGLLVVAGLMTLCIALGNSWVMDAPLRWKLWRGAVMLCVVLFTYSGVILWISGSTGQGETAGSVGPFKPPPEENHGTTDSVSVSAVHHGTDEAVTARIGHPGQQPKLSPYTLTESFIIDIPYYGGEDGFPIPLVLMDEKGTEEYPLSQAYSCIAGILVLYASPPPAGGIKQIPGLDTNDRRAEALGQALRYCLIAEIHQEERGSSKAGFSVKKGSIAEYNPAILPPDSIDYPPEKLLALLATLPFGGNESIKMLYKYRALRVPNGSNVELATMKMDANDWVTFSCFRIEKRDVFSFIIGVAPINAAVGVVPGSFPDRYKLQQGKYVTYSFAITRKIEIARTPFNASDVDDYKTWMNGLWLAIRNKYDIRQLSRD